MGKVIRSSYSEQRARTLFFKALSLFAVLELGAALYWETHYWHPKKELVVEAPISFGVVTGMIAGVSIVFWLWLRRNRNLERKEEKKRKKEVKKVEDKIFMKNFYKRKRK